jgi:cyclopropane-fatty-acyl-phospholipid synthase
MAHAQTQHTEPVAAKRAATAPAALAPRFAPASTTPPGFIERLLEPTGVRINGNRPWDIQVRDQSVYKRTLRDGSLGLGEAYMAGAWDSEQLDETFTRLLRQDLDDALDHAAKLHFALHWLKERIINRQSRGRAFTVGERHYDIGNDVYQAMLDPTMSYSCGYWADADGLDAAQLAKLALICRKLELAPGQRLLDIGCGWGGLAAYAAEHHGVEVVGITVSRNQAALAKERCKDLPVDIRLMDYRDVPKQVGGRFERLVSVGMFEHVGVRNYPAYFDVARQMLADDGLFLLHTIGNTRTVAITDAWTDTYIFPNGKIPSAQEIARALEERFVVEDWHNFGPDYDPTLMAWWQRFDAAWPDLRANYDDVFYRMWKYYLHASAGFFRSRQGQVWQIVLSKRARPGVYRSVR